MGAVDEVAQETHEIGNLEPPVHHEALAQFQLPVEGLDGKQPERFYRFSKRGDLTTFYVPRPGSRPTLLAPPPAL